MRPSNARISAVTVTAYVTANEVGQALSIPVSVTAAEDALTVSQVLIHTHLIKGRALRVEAGLQYY